MIELQNITKRYGTTLALDQVNLHVKAGECVVLIGPSGCGKSTLLKTINRLTPMDDGIVLINQKDASIYRKEQLRRQIGYCIQGVGLFPHLTVKENIAIVPKMLKWADKQIDERVAYLLELTGLPFDYINKKPHQLSGGEAQRVGVCRALAADPPILLMDEPFGAVDPLTREKIQLAFKQIHKKLDKTVLFVTHDVEEAILIGDRVAIMNQGKILALKTPGQLALTVDPIFVQEFLGADYTLQLLKRYSVHDLIIEQSTQQVSGLIYKNSSFNNVKDILAAMIKSSSQDIVIDMGNARYIKVTYQAIIDLLKRVTDNE